MHAPATLTHSDRPSHARASVADAPDGLDWQRFSARYFAGRRRHNLEALTAYGRYRTTSHARLAPQSRETSPHTDTRAHDAAALAAAAIQTWEAEGGSAQ